MYITENWSFLSNIGKHRLLIWSVIVIMVSNRYCFLRGFLFVGCFVFFIFAMTDEKSLAVVLLPGSAKAVSCFQKGSKKHFESSHRRIFSLLVLLLVSDRKLWSDCILELFCLVLLIFSLYFHKRQKQGGNQENQLIFYTKAPQLMHMWSQRTISC